MPFAHRKQLLPPLGRRDFCRPAKLGPLQGAEVDGYGCGATLWVVWKGCYDGTHKIEREWNKHEEREVLQRRIEYLAEKALLSNRFAQHASTRFQNSRNTSLEAPHNTVRSFAALVGQLPWPSACFSEALICSLQP